MILINSAICNSQTRALVLHLFVLIPHSHRNKHSQIGHHKPSQEEEEQINTTLVEVVWQPWPSSDALAACLHRPGEGACQVAAHGCAQQAHGHGAAAHHVRGLVVEELQLPDGGEHLREADQKVRWGLPEDRQGGGLVGRVRLAISFCCLRILAQRLQAPHLHCAGVCHGQRSDQHAPSLPSELGHLVALRAHQEWLKVCIIQPDEQDDGQGVEDGHRCARYIDVVTPRNGHRSVHEVALLHKQRAHLGVNGPIQHCGAKDGQQAQHQLHLLNLLWRVAC
mmetsp:Transcript_6671/g.17856  ORF Transcript_6671/g.17856 Transcript_6671/m.17856 type:complete len:280 (-) Transcript_6671:1255-2094(-)